MTEKSERHAYLVMAHDNFCVLEKLVRLLDDERCDIYLHIDKKAKDFDFDRFRALVKKSALIFTKKRLDIRWGEQSQVMGELLLYKTAYKHGGYSYYHFISGTTLPLKSRNDICDFFKGRQDAFIFYKAEFSEYDRQRISRFHFFINKNGKFISRIKDYSAYAQEKLKIDRTKKYLRRGMMLAKGENWCSLPEEAVRILLENRRMIEKITRYSLCSDEMYKQIILLSAGYPIKNESLVFSTWQDGEDHPEALTEQHLSQAFLSGKLFARKFDDKISRGVADMIFEYNKTE